MKKRGDFSNVHVEVANDLKLLVIVKTWFINREICRRRLPNRCTYGLRLCGARSRCSFDGDESMWLVELF